ncbi:MAG: type III pantothenate kinase [Bacillota bacterium]|jgi:type III pantothenate kinase|nr:type III pantothenate kinase [Bacillota bacterium]
MLLALDIGNTNTCIGIYDGKRLMSEWRVSTDRRKTRDEYRLMLGHMAEVDGIDAKGIEASAISSVVPPLTPIWEAALQKYLGSRPLIIGPGVKTGMDLRYDSPKDVGADRIAGAVAAYENYGGPCIIVDFGTATTFDAVSKSGQYLGGAIAPGIGISLEALFEHAARLPRIDLVRPRGVIGRNTVWAMQAGIVYGFAGQVEFIVARMKEELGENAFVVATGGLAPLIAYETRVINKVDPLLVLEGIRIVWERNRESLPEAPPPDER